MITKFGVLSTTLLGLTFAAACANGHALSLASMLHIHPHLANAANPRGSLTLTNPNSLFRDVKVDNKVYTLPAYQHLTITAQVGTPVYAASKMFRGHAPGSILALVQPGSKTLAVD